MHTENTYYNITAHLKKINYNQFQSLLWVRKMRGKGWEEENNF